MKQDTILVVAETWGLYTGSRVVDASDLPTIAPTAHRARQLIHRSPQKDRPLIFKDLTALAEAMSLAKTGPVPIAIYRLRSRNGLKRTGWHLFTFNPSDQ